MADLVAPATFNGVTRPVGYSAYAQEQKKNSLAEALAQAQIMSAQATAMKSLQPDIDDLGKQAFLKAAQGMPISAEETAALQYLDNKSQTASFNPVTGNMEMKPSLLGRAGINIGSPAIAPTRDMSPQQARNTPMSDEQAAKVVDLFEPTGLPVSPSEYQSEWDDAYARELAAAAGNPRLQQTIKSDYAKAKMSMTEAEAKAAGFADRMLQSNPIIEKTTNAGTDLSERSKAEIPILGNFITSGDYKSFNQAQRDFINAQLRRESGAVISPAEFDNAEKQYFPVPGDDANVLAQKKANRDSAVSAMQRSAGPAYKPPKIAPLSTVLSDKDKAESIFNAKKAIKAGKPRDAIRQRLLDAGINPAEAGL